ncbi:hypothetical protein Msil_1589 [Methylocella silvestris BL2]|uniref:Uncharacterized protein n=1 Tax=Methylocella silvestris (strain DSM 15510 / CIP 108128 / LMG 27833 / NCIMB 13906 / BL2) TaxID=395965 RepID=B8EI56_METSB|nr:hypothetical protein [Methylocella silvestris]ACK50538.1 hypothetical protein Msil_1589 [Methylocella silvestris BL2]
MSLNAISTIGLRLYLGFALCVFSALAMALAASYLGGGSTPATILYSFLCVGCSAGPSLLALAAGAILAAALLRTGRRAASRRQQRTAPSIGTVKPQC